MGEVGLEGKGMEAQNLILNRGNLRCLFVISWICRFSLGKRSMLGI